MHGGFKNIIQNRRNDAGMPYYLLQPWLYFNAPQFVEGIKEY